MKIITSSTYTKFIEEKMHRFSTLKVVSSNNFFNLVGPFEKKKKFPVVFKIIREKIIENQTFLCNWFKTKPIFFFSVTETRITVDI